MMELIGLLAILIGILLFNLALFRWAVDSTDGIDSSEWERRRRWRGFVGP